MDEGATPIRDWVGAPWASNGSDLYIELRPGGWWPTEEAIANGATSPAERVSAGQPELGRVAAIG